MFPLLTCQQRWAPPGEIHVMGRDPSLSLVTGDGRTLEMNDAKSKAPRMDARMLRGWVVLCVLVFELEWSFRISFIFIVRHPHTNNSRTGFMMMQGC